MRELVLIIGPCGAGKTTYARQHYAQHIHLDTDAFIRAMFADARLVWYPYLHAASRRMQHVALEYLLPRAEVCLTESGETRRKRQKWIELAHDHQAPLHLIRLVVPATTCIARAQADPTRPPSSKQKWPKIVAHWFRAFEPIDCAQENIASYQEVEW